MNDAVELSALFQILDQDITRDYSKVFFKNNVLENYKGVIDENLKPSQNLI